MCIHITRYACGAESHSDIIPGAKDAHCKCSKKVYYLPGTANCDACIHHPTSFSAKSALHKAKDIGLVGRDFVLPPDPDQPFEEEEGSPLSPLSKGTKSPGSSIAKNASPFEFFRNRDDDDTNVNDSTAKSSKYRKLSPKRKPSMDNLKIDCRLESSLLGEEPLSDPPDSTAKITNQLTDLNLSQIPGRVPDGAFKNPHLQAQAKEITDQSIGTGSTGVSIFSKNQAQDDDVKTEETAASDIGSECAKEDTGKTGDDDNKKATSGEGKDKGKGNGKVNKAGKAGAAPAA